MNFKTILVTLIIGFGCAYVVQNMDMFIKKDAAYCSEYYQKISEPEYAITYGERVKATLNGCL